jgi:hypothetical protein
MSVMLFWVSASLPSVGLPLKSSPNGRTINHRPAPLVSRQPRPRHGESNSDEIIRVARGVGLFLPDYEPAGTGRSPDDDGLLRAAAYDGKVDNR